MEESLNVRGLDCKEVGDKIVCEILPEKGEKRSIEVDTVELKGFSLDEFPYREAYEKPVSCRIKRSGDVVKLICNR